MFNPDIECPTYAAQKELGYDPHPNQILEEACPLCPHRPKRLEK